MDFFISVLELFIDFINTDNVSNVCYNTVIERFNTY